MGVICVEIEPKWIFYHDYDNATNIELCEVVYVGSFQV